MQSLDILFCHLWFRLYSVWHSNTFGACEVKLENVFFFVALRLYFIEFARTFM